MYNTVLGARPLRADGHAFYYADYHNAGRKVYSNHRFPCCSGTLPQVATDYGINAYLHDGHDLYVNLYVPSRLRWQRRGARVTLQQRGDYPFGDAVSLRVGTSRPHHFTVHLRIPAWAGAARVTVNGRAWDGAAEPGTFAALSRSWRDGDRIELELPRRPRLEALDTRHPDTVALLAGPLVLFPIRSGAAPRAGQRAELLAARQTAAKRWEAVVGGAAVSLLPYVAIDEEAYSTFLAVSG